MNFHPVTLYEVELKFPHGPIIPKTVYMIYS